jgi:DNA-binding response OmpR family regulator
LEHNRRVRVLLVEDDPRMRALVRRALEEQGHAVVDAGDGPSAVDAAEADRFDTIVLDVMLPGFDGIEVVRRLRRADDSTPVLLLTARDADAEIVSGLDAGADDYLTKPFALAVLLARLRALDRRYAASHGPVFTIADLIIDSASHAVTRAGSPVRLTRTEHELLEYLARHAGRVVRRQTLLDRLWGGDRDVESNTLDAFVKSLRQKVDAGRTPRLIQTIRGVGYSLRAEPE